MNLTNLSLILYVAGGLLDILISVLVGLAARRKDRSFFSFFILSVLMGVLLPALVVAAIPFRPEDRRRSTANAG